ncbi:MAG: N-acetylmuramoyl-L-alanine amidase, partial [Lachnospiraceae bacterium]|nr:N-acetylmuramoyl-L-alanine amidase [Lachnospiraceae bacterium]
MRRRRIKKTSIQAFLLAAVMLFSSVCGQYGGQVNAQVRDFAEDENVVVVLDPGHGSWNPGACNKKYGLKERELNLKVSKYTKQYLEQYEGVEVYLTRKTNSEDYSLKKRAQIAAGYNADLLVSQHFDGSTDKSQNGAHVIVSRSNYIKEYNAGCEQLGRLICKNLHAATGVKIRYPGSGGVRTRKTEQGREYTFEDGTKSKADYYGIIQNSIRLGFPAIIIEHATLTNNKDAKMIKKESTLKALAKADALAIAQYFHLEKRKSGGGDVSLTYRCSMQDIGWQGYKGSGETAGTMQFKKQMEALYVSLENEATETAISGSAYIGDGVGWKEA